MHKQPLLPSSPRRTNFFPAHQQSSSTAAALFSLVCGILIYCFLFNIPQPVHSQLGKCSPLIENGVVSEGAFFSYFVSTSDLSFGNSSKSANNTYTDTYSQYLYTQTFISGVSSKLLKYDRNTFYFLGIIDVDRTMMNQQGETIDVVLSRKKSDQSVSLLDVIPFIKGSTFGMSRNSGVFPLYYKLHFGQGNEARDNLTTSISSGSAFSGMNGYDNSGNVMTMMNLQKFNSTFAKKISTTAEFASYSTKLESTFIFTMGARAFNTTNNYLYNNDLNIRLNASVIEHIPRSNSDNLLVLSFIVNDNTYPSLFSAMELSTKSAILPFPTIVSGLSYQFLRFNISDSSSVPCPTFPVPILFSSLLNTTLTIDWILFGLVFLLTPLFILYRNEQPLKSRLVVPYLGIVFLLILFIGVQYSNDINNGSSRPSEIKNIVSVSFFIMALVAFVFQTLRYYYLRYLYSKVDISVKQSRMKKFLSSKTLFVMAIALAVILGLIYLIVVLSVALTITAVTRQSTFGQIDVEVEYYTRIAIPAFAALVLFTCIFIDIVVNFKSFFSRNIGRFFFFEDPLFFRSELLLVIPICIFYIVEFVLNSQTRPYIDGSITVALIPKTTHDIRAMIGFIGIFRFFNLFCFVLLFGEALVLAVTISRVIRRNHKLGKKGLALLLPVNSPLFTFRKKNVNIDEDVIEKFISQEDGHKLLEEFSRNEFSVENILLFDIIQKFANEKNVENQKKTIIDIYLKFIQAHSEYEINLSSSTRKAYELLVEDVQEDKAVQITELFQTLKIEIIQNMSDTFSRLSMSPEYDRLLAKWDTEQATALKV